MSITDELREWSKDRMFMGNGCAELTAIADRIDAAHKHAVGYVDDRDPETMAENGWVKLPVDAGGEPCRIGDKVDSDHYEDGTVVGVHYFKAPNGVVFEEIAVQPNEWDTATWRDPEDYRHHHAPTVEDVLREFALACEDAGNAGPEVKRIAAEYAAKLRLAEEVA